MTIYNGSGKWNAHSGYANEFAVGFDNISSSFYARLVFEAPSDIIMGSNYEVFIKLKCIPPYHNNKIPLGYTKAYLSTIDEVPPGDNSQFPNLASSELTYSKFYTDPNCTSPVVVDEDGVYTLPDTADKDILYLKLNLRQIELGKPYYIYFIPHASAEETVADGFYVKGTPRIFTRWSTAEGDLEISLKQKAYTITYNGNGGIAERVEDIVEIGTFIELPNASRNSDKEFTITGLGSGGIDKTALASNSYALLGWSTDSQATEGLIGDYEPTGDVTLYAIWRESYLNNTPNALGESNRNNKYKTITTTLVLNNGEKNQTKTSQETTTFDFRGWSQDENGEVISKDTPFFENTTLYAVWAEEKTYGEVPLSNPTPSPAEEDISFIIICHENYGEDMTNKVKVEGIRRYFFGGWTLEGEVIDLPYSPSEDTTLEALYLSEDIYETRLSSLKKPERKSLEENFTIIGKVPTDIDGISDTKLQAIKTLSYNCVGWNTVPTVNEVLGKDTILSPEFSDLYAIWDTITTYKNNSLTDLPRPESGHMSAGRTCIAFFETAYGNAPEDKEEELYNYMEFDKWDTQKTEFTESVEINAIYKTVKTETALFQLPIVYASGRTHLGWETNGFIYGAESWITISENTNFNALWSDKPTPRTRIYIFT